MLFLVVGALAFACTMHTVLSRLSLVYGVLAWLYEVKGSVTKAYVMKKEMLVMRTYIGQLVFTILMSMTFEMQDVPQIIAGRR